ncbi:peptidase T, partial [Vibrio parahaemolyticus AQ3810]
HPRF